MLSAAVEQNVPSFFVLRSMKNRIQGQSTSEQLSALYKFAKYKMMDLLF